MIKVRPYKDGGWEVDFVVHGDPPKRKRLKSPHASATASRRWGYEKWAEANGLGSSSPPASRTEVNQTVQAQPPRNQPPTLEAFAHLPEDLASCERQTFGAYCRERRLSPSTVRAYRCNLRRWILPLLGSHRLDGLGRAEFQDLREELEDHSTKTSNNVVALLHRVLVVAAHAGILEAGAIPGYEPLPLRESPFAFYGVSQLSQLVGAARALGPRHLGIVALGADAGLRAGEMAGLQGGDIVGEQLVIARSRDFPGRRDVPTKNKQVRRLKMSQLVKEALAGLPGGKRAHVLRGDDGEPVAYGQLRSWLGDVQARAGLERVGLHALRHTFATNLLEAGVQPQVVMALGGWSSLAMVQRYTHVVDRHKSAGIDALDRLRTTKVLETVWRNLGDGGSSI